MAFCPKCGASVADGTAFCNNCGNALNSAPQQAAPQQAAPTYTPPAYNPYAAPVATPVKPKIAGRGFGISSLVLSIIGLVMSFYCMSITSVADAITDAAGVFGSAAKKIYQDEVITAILVYSVLSILAVAFGAAAIKKGYSNGVSKAGLVMGIIGLAVFLIAIFNCL